MINNKLKVLDKVIVDCSILTKTHCNRNYSEFRLNNKEGKILSILSNNEHAIIDFGREKTIIRMDCLELLRNRVLIGYKLIKKQYAAAACKIIGYFEFGESISNGNTIDINNTKEAFKKLEAAGVLNLWFEPVYKTINIDEEIWIDKNKEYKVEFKNGTTYISNYEFSYSWWKAAQIVTNHSNNKFLIKVGCFHQYDLSTVTIAKVLAKISLIKLNSKK